MAFSLSGIPSKRLPSMPIAATAADCTYREEHSVGAIFHGILPRVITGCSMYWEIHMSKREIFKELNFNIPAASRLSKCYKIDKSMISDQKLYPQKCVRTTNECKIPVHLKKAKPATIYYSKCIPIYLNLPTNLI